MSNPPACIPATVCTQEKLSPPSQLTTTNTLTPTGSSTSQLSQPPASKPAWREETKYDDKPSVSFSSPASSSDEEAEPARRHPVPCATCGKTLHLRQVPVSGRLYVHEGRCANKAHASEEGSAKTQTSKRARSASPPTRDGKLTKKRKELHAKNRAVAKAFLQSRLKGLEGKAAVDAVASDPKLTAAMDVPRHVASDGEATDAGRRKATDEAEPKEQAWCQRMLDKGVCALGEECPERHPKGPPLALPTLDPEAHNGKEFRLRRDPYPDNPEAAQQRIYEPLDAAYADYVVPALRWEGLDLAFSATGDAVHRMHKVGFGFYVDTGNHRRVRLIRHVVDAMRTYFAHAPRSMEAAEFYIAAQRCVRVCSNLRIDSAEVRHHKHYATLVAYYAADTNNDAAGIKNNYISLRRPVEWLRRMGTPSPATCAALASCSVLLSAAAAQVVFSEMRVIRLARALERAHRKSAAKRAAQGSLVGHLITAKHFAEALLEEVTQETQELDALMEPAACTEAANFIMGLNIVIVSPIIEELAKKAFGKWFTAGLITVETLVSLATALPRGPGALVRAAIVRSGTNLMHVLAHALPIWASIPLHGTWNVVMPQMSAAFLEGAKGVPLIEEAAEVVISSAAGAAGPGVCAALIACSLVSGIAADLARKSFSQGEVARSARPLRRIVRTPSYYDEERRFVKANEATCSRDASVIPDAFLFKGRLRPARPVRVFEGEVNGPQKESELGAGVSVTIDPSSKNADADVGWGAIGDEGRLGDEVSRGFTGVGSAASRAVVALYGFGSGPFRPTYPAREAENSVAVMLHRVGKKVPEADPATLRDFIAFLLDPAVRSRVLRFPNGTPVRNIKPMRFDRWLAGLGSSPEVKARIARTKEEMDARGITASKRISKTHLRQIMKSFKIFIKREGLSLRSPEGLASKAYRPIFPQCAEALIIIGPWLAAFQAVLYKCWHKDHFITLAGQGLTGEDIGGETERLHSAGWAILEDDCGAWDMTVNENVEPLNHAYVELYRSLGMPPGACDVLDHLYSKPKFVMDGITMVKLGGNQFSGLPDTLSRNSYHNGYSHLYILLRRAGCSVEEADRIMRMFLAGDDNLLLHVFRYGVDWCREMGALGHAADGIYRDHPSEAGFCSSVCVDSDRGMIMTPLPGRFLSRNGYYCDPPRDVEREQLVRGTALSSYAQFAHVPPVRAFLDRQLELTTGHIGVAPPRLAHKLSSHPPAKCTPSTWENLNHRYPEWGPTVQSDWEDYLSTIQLGDEITFPAALAMMHRDTDGPKSLGDPSGAPGVGPLPGSLGGFLYAVTETPREPLFGPMVALPRLGSPIEKDWVSYGWALSAKERNRLAHALNGNQSAPLKVAALAGAVAYMAAMAARHVIQTTPVEMAQVYVIFSRDKRITFDVPIVNGTISSLTVYGEVSVQTGLNPEEFYLMLGPKQVTPVEDVLAVPVLEFDLKIRGRGGGRSTKKKGGSGGARAKSAKKQIVVVAASASKKKRKPPAGAIRGAGDYTLPSRERGKMATVNGESWGSAVGRVFGGPTGSVVGHALHRGIKYFTGWGDYAERQRSYNDHMVSLGHPDHVDAVLQGSPAQFASAARGTLVTFRECIIANLAGSAAQRSVVVPLNPGQKAFTPWASNFASSFQEWRLKACVFEFRSTMSPSFTSTSGATGKIAIGSVYNPTMLPFSDMTQLLNTMYSVSGKPTESFYHLIECDPAEMPLKLFDVRTNAASAVANTDLRMSDPGFVQIMTQGNPVEGAPVGDIWVSYVIEFLKPAQSSLASPGAQLMAHLAGTTMQSSTGAGTLLKLNSVYKSGPVDTMRVPYTVTLPGRIAFDFSSLPPGRYRCFASMAYYAPSALGAGFIGSPVTTIPQASGLEFGNLATWTLEGKVAESGFYVDVNGAARAFSKTMMSGAPDVAAYSMSGSLQAVYSTELCVSLSGGSGPAESFVIFNLTAKVGAQGGNAVHCWDFAFESMPSLPSSADGRHRPDPTLASAARLEELERMVSDLMLGQRAAASEAESGPEHISSLEEPDPRYGELVNSPLGRAALREHNRGVLSPKPQGSR